MKYEIYVSHERKVFNIFDEDNKNFIPDEFIKVCEIFGDDNIEQVEKLIWVLRPDLKLDDTFI